MQVAIRPEAVRLRPVPADGGTPNTVAGRVAGVSFLGDVVQYVVLVDGEEIMARVPHSRALPLAADAEVLLEWDAEDVKVYADEG